MAVAVFRNAGRVTLALLLTACVGFEGVKHAAYLWVALGLVAPELTMLARIPRRLAHGYRIGVALILLSLPDPIPLAVFIVGLAWVARIAAERALRATLSRGRVPAPARTDWSEHETRR
jgi:hypothetical protein